MRRCRPGGNGRKSIDPALVKKLKDSARGSVTISVNPATEFASFIVSGRNGDLLPGTQHSPMARRRASSGSSAASSVSRMRLRSRPDRGVTDDVGATHVTYEQATAVCRSRAGSKAHVDAAGNLTAVNGTPCRTSRSARLRGSAPARRAHERSPRSSRIRRADESGRPRSPRAISAPSAQLFVYRIGLVKGDEGTSELVYEVTVTNGSSVRDAVFVHANAGKVVNRYSLVDDALFRRLFEQNTRNQVWQEGDPFPGSLNGDQQNIVNFSGHSYNHFFNAFGRDSYDAPAPSCGASTTTRPSTARTPTGTARPRTTATASPPTTSSRTSGVTRTRSTRTT